MYISVLIKLMYHSLPLFYDTVLCRKTLLYRASEPRLVAPY